MTALFRFDNGIVVPRAFLLPEQMARYQSNVAGVYHEPVEERLFGEALCGLGAGSCYLNVGAAWGYYAILARKTVPALRVHAVEAHPQMCSLLFAAAHENGVNGITVVNAAVVGHASVHEPLYLEFGYGAAVRADNETAQGQRVAATDLPALVEALPGYDRLFVSMDIQGKEADVLADLALIDPSRQPATILVGTHGAERHEQSRDVLRAQGYAIAHDDPAPVGQPDGILLAHKARKAGATRRRQPARA